MFGVFLVLVDSISPSLLGSELFTGDGPYTHSDAAPRRLHLPQTGMEYSHQSFGFPEGLQTCCLPLCRFGAIDSSASAKVIVRIRVDLEKTTVERAA